MVSTAGGQRRPEGGHHADSTGATRPEGLLLTLRRASSLACGALFLTLGFGAQGCALQTGIGAHAPGPERFPFSSTSSLVLMSPSGQGPIAAAHTVIADPSGEAQLGFRSLVGAAGWRFMARGGGAEIALEGGGGEPAFVDYDSPGMYLGASAAGLVRLYGDQDVTPGFAPVGFLFDLVTTARAGCWAPPAGQTRFDDQAEGRLELGLRITVLSDLLDISGEELEQ